MRVPLATYRIQFNQRFRFQDAGAIVPYLDELGISDLYASPCLVARKGSMHGYDVTDPTRLNPELGTEMEFEALSQERKRCGMGLLLDIVPNHMAVSLENPWWADVLENGPSSAYASFFDIHWQPGNRFLENKVLIPTLGDYYGKVLENQEMTLNLTENGFVIRYYGTAFPVEPRSSRAILTHLWDVRAEGLKGPTAFQELEDLITAVEHLPPYTTTQSGEVEKRRRGVRDIKQWLWRLYTERPEIKGYVDLTLKAFNGKKGAPRSLDALDRLLGDQVYRLVYWRKAGEGINYRRFFDITDLAGLRVEDPKVFGASHALILEWLKHGTVTGLRIDHIDGLRDPLGYLERLQGGPPAQEGSQSTYVIVEKILCGDEELRDEWPVSGTSGYEFLDRYHDVFLNPRGVKELDAIYSRFIGEKISLDEIRYRSKKLVVEQLFRSEMDTLCRQLARLAEGDRYACDLSLDALSLALKEVTAILGVYRTYIRDAEISAEDRRLIHRALSEARARNSAVPAPALDLIRRVLGLDFNDSCPEAERENRLQFVMQWQQLTGPAMAKGFEDTTLYNYNRLISMNDVGCDPNYRGLSVGHFHQWNQRRLKNYPHTLNATSTHDTKRSEDVRARIHVLCDLATEWGRRVERWKKENRNKKTLAGGIPVPDSNEEYLIYQTLIGAWPLSRNEIPAFKTRLKAYLIKAAREAKVYSSWLHPDEAHEKALLLFVDRLFGSSGKNRFLSDFHGLQGKIAWYGAINSLTQVLLKAVSPGVPDFYQGTELWDLSLVDPDNRRDVDFEKRIRHLEDMKKREAEDPEGLLNELLSHWQDGRIKLFLTAKVLNFRKSHPELFLDGAYLPLDGTGGRKECLLALARRKGDSWAVAVVPRSVPKLAPEGAFPLGKKTWGQNLILLPNRAPRAWRNVLTGEEVQSSVRQGKKTLPLHQVLRRFPVALLSGTLK